MDDAGGSRAVWDDVSQRAADSVLDGVAALEDDVATDRCNVSDEDGDGGRGGAGFGASFDGAADGGAGDTIFDASFAEGEYVDWDVSADDAMPYGESADTSHPEAWCCSWD
jgi:hypothetical protein